LFTPLAAAAEAEDCEQWFPDLNCERSGRWEGFRKPIVSAFLFEDPFITTGAYLYHVYHEFPDRSVLGGGEANVAALQLRVALTDRIALIATKDGRAWVDPDLPVLAEREGWLNVAAGVKGILAESQEDRWIVSGVLRFELDSGSTDVFQGHGSGVVIPSISAAWGPGRFHVIGDLGMEIPIDGHEQSSSIFYHLYADYMVTERFSPFAQITGQHWVSSGDGSIEVDFGGGNTLPLKPVQALLGVGSFEGADVLNLGVDNVAGLDLITAAIGFHYALMDRVTLSVAYERPISHHKGVHKQRITSALVYEF
jgi:hypothetical protein